MAPVIPFRFKFWQSSWSFDAKYEWSGRFCNLVYTHPLQIRDAVTWKVDRISPSKSPSLGGHCNMMEKFRLCREAEDMTTSSLRKGEMEFLVSMPDTGMISQAIGLEVPISNDSPQDHITTSFWAFVVTFWAGARHRSILLLRSLAKASLGLLWPWSRKLIDLKCPFRVKLSIGGKFWASHIRASGETASGHKIIGWYTCESAQWPYGFHDCFGRYYWFYSRISSTLARRATTFKL